MDGLLLDTEPLWGESMFEVAEKHEVNIRYDLFKHTTGYRIYEVTAFWKENFGWKSDITAPLMAEEILDNIIQRAQTKGRVMPGVIQTIELLKSMGIPLGVATSSPQRMTDTLLQYFNIYHYFDFVSTADKVSFGKPHPDVYLRCAAQLQVDSWKCLAFEDSLNGMIAAKAARMKTVLVPENIFFEPERFSISDLVLPTLENFTLNHWLHFANPS